MNFTYVHVFIVVSIAILIIIKVDISIQMFLFLFSMLSIQFWLIYSKFKVSRKELFQDDLTLHSLDIASLKKLQNLPKHAQTYINNGLDALIETTTSKTELSQLSPEDKIYSDVNVRKQYKHIDYLLQKIKEFDINVYDALISHSHDNNKL